MKTATLSMSVQVSGDGVSETYNIMAANPVVNANAPGGGPVNTALASGDNPLTVPPNSIGMIFVPLSSSTVVFKLKGVGGDTGFTIAPNLPALISLPPGTTQALVNASTSCVVAIMFI